MPPGWTGGLTLLLVLMVAAGAVAFLRSPYFRLEVVEVQGIRSLEGEEVRGLMDVSGGQHLYSFSLAELERQIASDPRVGDVTVQRMFPGALQVVVQERLPVALVVRGGVFGQLDEEGRVIAVDESWPGLALPMITGYPTDPLVLGERVMDHEVPGLQAASRLEGIAPYVSEIYPGESGPILLTVEGGEVWLPGIRGDMLTALERLASGEGGLPGRGCIHDYRSPEHPVKRCP